VKQEVKGRVLQQLAQWEEETTAPYTKDEVMALCESHLQDIETIADETLREAGYAYTANAYLTREEFPIRRYGDLTFPAGVYDALRIDLGVAAGHNWWCMLYPSLCFVDATYSVVPEESKEELKSLVTDADYEALLQDSDTEIEIHSAVVDWIQDWFAK
jgi:stage II sporulation protein R